MDRGRILAGALCLALQAGCAATPAGTTAQAPPAPTATQAAPVSSPPSVGSKAALPRDPQELRRDPVQALDITGDGAVDAAEVKSAAAARYDVLNPALDEQLRTRAAAPSLSAGEFRQADTDRNGVLSKAEYLALAERRHGEADADGDGKLGQSELSGPRSEPLLRLLR